MRLTLLQNGLSYSVYENDTKEISYSGSSKVVLGELSGDFFDKNKKQIFYIRNNFRPFKSWKMYYEVVFYSPDLVTVKIEHVKIFKGYWRMLFKKDVYDYYIHNGHKKSLYKNGVQVAKYDKKIFNLFNRDAFYVVANNDENKSVLLAFLIAFNLGKDNGDSSFTFDLGNLRLGREVKEFDKNWIPNHSL